MNQSANTDRYISFCDIECDQNADKLIDRLKTQLSKLPEDNNWKRYFSLKFSQQRQMQYDNLFYIGCQTNTLYEFFEFVRDKESTALLQQIEEECC